MLNQYSFKNDYSEGAHPDVLNAIVETNTIQAEGYGSDIWCDEARSLIRDHIAMPQADIHFVSGGTQANLIVISSLLRPHEAVIAADTGHIAVHEAGAIEATGHKICTIGTESGKLEPQDISSVIEAHADEHMVKPRLVFISNSTELGTIYTRSELEALSLICRKHQLYLYLDGARLASALTSSMNDICMSEIARLVDAFYIGGTKNGILAGEAIILTNKDLQADFRYFMKQKGALLAKGRFIGLQFKALFSTELFYKLGRNANLQAQRLAKGIEEAGYGFLYRPESNQIFPVLPDALIKYLHEDFSFYIWQKVQQASDLNDDVLSYSAIRLVCSWATPDEAVSNFLKKLSEHQA